MALELHVRKEERPGFCRVTVSQVLHRLDAGGQPEAYLGESAIGEVQDVTISAEQRRVQAKATAITALKAKLGVTDGAE